MGAAERIDEGVGVHVELPPRLPVFGVGVSRADEMVAVVDPIVRAARARRPLMVSALSVHALMMAASRPEMARAIAQADIVTTDGQPVRWAMNLLHGVKLRERICGPDLVLAVSAVLTESS